MIVIAAFICEQNKTIGDSADFCILVLVLLALFSKYFTLIFIFELAIGSNSSLLFFSNLYHPFIACMHWMTQHHYWNFRAYIRWLSLALLLSSIFIYLESFIPVFFCILISLIFYGFFKNLTKNMQQIQKYPLCLTVKISVFDLCYPLFFKDAAMVVLLF